MTLLIFYIVCGIFSWGVILRISAVIQGENDLPYERPSSHKSFPVWFFSIIIAALGFIGFIPSIVLYITMCLGERKVVSLQFNPFKPINDWNKQKLKECIHCGCDSPIPEMALLDSKRRVHTVCHQQHLYRLSRGISQRNIIKKLGI